jgi:hypothetical protein
MRDCRRYAQLLPASLGAAALLWLHARPPSTREPAEPCDLQCRIVRDTARFRPAAHFMEANSAGPWIANAYFDAWVARPPASRLLYLPIMWDDILHLDGHFLPTVGKYVATLPRTRSYYTVLQADRGFRHPGMARLRIPRDLDLLLFSAGEPTHAWQRAIPIPLLSPQTAARAGLPKHHAFTFVGFLSTDPLGLRARMCGGAHGLQCFERRPDWARVTEQSVLTLAPRGYGETSYRLYEAIKLGSVPVYTSDTLWLPLQELMNWTEVAVLDTTCDPAAVAVAAAAAPAEQMAARLPQVAGMFTYNFVVNYINMRVEAA